MLALVGAIALSLLLSSCAALWVLLLLGSAERGADVLHSQGNERGKLQEGLLLNVRGVCRVMEIGAYWK